MTIHSNQFSFSFKLSITVQYRIVMLFHDDVIKWTHFPRYICTGILLGESIAGGYPHKGHWRGALLFYLICAWTNGSANNGDDGDLRRHCAHYDVTVIYTDEATDIWDILWVCVLQLDFSVNNPNILHCWYIEVTFLNVITKKVPFQTRN